MIIDPFKEKPVHRKWAGNQGCSCATCLRPPCGWCESLTEEECEIFDCGGEDAVIEHRLESD